MDNKATKTLQLGRKIFTYRKEKGYSQNELAELLGISREHLAKVETGIRCLSFGLLVDIADKLDKPVKHFIDF